MRTISKSISDSYLMEMAAGLDAVRLTDKKVKAPIAIAETAEDEEEENIDLEIPLEVDVCTINFHIFKCVCLHS